MGQEEGQMACWVQEKKGRNRHEGRHPHRETEIEKHKREWVRERVQRTVTVKPVGKKKHCQEWKDIS